MIGGIGVFDKPEFPVEAGRFSLHQGKLLLGHTTDLNAPSAGRKLGLWRSDKKSLGIADGEVVHRQHQLGGFDLSLWPHFLEIGKAVDRYVLVLEECRRVLTYTVEQPPLSSYVVGIYIQDCSEPVFRHSPLDGFQDHPVLLNDCE